jgi:hypothetical protein
MAMEALNQSSVSLEDSYRFNTYTFNKKATNKTIKLIQTWGIP